MIPTRGPFARSTDRQRRALGACVLVGVALLLWIARPVGSGLLLGGLLAFSLQPVHARLRARRGAAFAAFFCAIGASGAIALSGSWLGYLFVVRGVTVVSAVPALLARGAPLRAFVDRVSAPLHVSTGEVIERLRSEAINLGSSAAVVAADLVGLSLHALLTLFFMGITTYFVLRHWERLILRAEVVLPLHPRHTRTVFAQLGDVGRHVFIGTLATALAQGALAALGYRIFGVPEWAFFGILTALAALIPAIGTMLVWAPIGAYLLMIGHPIAGALELGWGLVVVIGIPDYVLRPKLVGGGHDAIPTLLTFVALFGGVEVFGPIGLILGPVLVSLTVALLRTYYDEMALGTVPGQARVDELEGDAADCPGRVTGPACARPGALKTVPGDSPPDRCHDEIPAPSSHRSDTGTDPETPGASRADDGAIAGALRSSTGRSASS